MVNVVVSVVVVNVVIVRPHGVGISCAIACWELLNDPRSCQQDPFRDLLLQPHNAQFTETGT